MNLSKCTIFGLNCVIPVCVYMGAFVGTTYSLYYIGVCLDLHGGR